MPHPIINSSTQLDKNGFYYVDSALVQYSVDKWKCGTTRNPASTNNPKVHGYRQPANWYSRRDRWEALDGRIVQRMVLPPYTVLTAQGNISGFGLTEADNLLVLDPSLSDDLLRTTLSKMLEDDVAFNAFLAQGKQTLKMVANLSTGLAKGVDNLWTAAHGNPRNWKRWLATAGDTAIKDFSGRYLEYLYGWKPLADDVENAFQSMIDGYTGPEQKRFRLQVRGRRKLRDTVQLSRNVSAYFSLNWQVEQDLLREQSAKLVLNYAFPAQAGEMLPTLTPFGTAWELAPWSFVVDWFIPIGNWVGAMEATQYAIYMQNAVLTRSVKVTSQPQLPSRWSIRRSIAGYVADQGLPPAVSGSGFYMTREVLSPVSVLDRIRFPSFSSKFGLPQATQALALLQQVINKWS